MNVELKTLSEAVLRRLTNDALTTFLGEAAGYEAAARPGLQLVLSNEPVADMNMLVVGAGADHDHFRSMVSLCLDRKLPFLVMIYPEAGGAFDDTANDLGLVYAVDFPIMVRDDMPLESSGNPNVNVTRATGAEDADASANIMVSAYSMPKESVLRAHGRGCLRRPHRWRGRGNRHDDLPRRHLRNLGHGYGCGTTAWWNRTSATVDRHGASPRKRRSTFFPGRNASRLPPLREARLQDCLLSPCLGVR